MTPNPTVKVGLATISKFDPEGFVGIITPVDKNQLFCPYQQKKDSSYENINDPQFASGSMLFGIIRH